MQFSPRRALITGITIILVLKSIISENSKDSLIRLFIFSKALVKEYGWKDSVSTEKYAKKYILHENDPKKLTGDHL